MRKTLSVALCMGMALTAFGSVAADGVTNCEGAAGRAHVKRGAALERTIGAPSTPLMDSVTLQALAASDGKLWVTLDWLYEGDFDMDVTAGGRTVSAANDNINLGDFTYQESLYFGVVKACDTIDIEILNYLADPTDELTVRAWIGG